MLAYAWNISGRILKKVLTAMGADYVSGSVEWLGVFPSCSFVTFDFFIKCIHYFFNKT